MEDTRASKLQQYYSMLYRYVRVRLGNDAEAVDIVQETLCRYTVSIADDDIPCSPSPEMLAFNSEENESLMKSVLSLSPKYKEVIYLYYYEDLSVDEISQITGRKPSTI